MPTIQLEDGQDRWRFTCPSGHTSWEATNGHFWCATCARAASAGKDAEPSFEQLRDRKNDELVERDEILLETENGPYEGKESGAEV